MPFMETILFSFKDNFFLYVLFNLHLFSSLPHSHYSINISSQTSPYEMLMEYKKQLKF